MGLLIFCPDIDGRENGLSTLVKNSCLSTTVCIGWSLNLPVKTVFRIEYLILKLLVHPSSFSIPCILNLNNFVYINNITMCHHWTTEKSVESTYFMLKLLGHAENHLKPQRVHGTKTFMNHCVRLIFMKMLN